MNTTKKFNINGDIMEFVAATEQFHFFRPLGELTNEYMYKTPDGLIPFTPEYASTFVEVSDIPIVIPTLRSFGITGVTLMDRTFGLSVELTDHPVTYLNSKGIHICAMTDTGDLLTENLVDQII